MRTRTSVVMRNFRIVHALRQLRACLTLVCVPILHKISLRDVSSPINFRNCRHHDHRGNTLFCLCFRSNRSHQLPLIRSQLPRNSNTRCTEHAIPSLQFHHSCNSRSSLHTIWREENRSTRSLVMSHVDTDNLWSPPRNALFSLTGLKCTDSPNSTAGRFQVFPHRR